MWSPRWWDELLPHRGPEVTFHKVGALEPGSRLNWSFQVDLGYREGTLHDLGMGCVWTHLSCSVVEFATRKMVQEQMTLKFLRNQSTVQSQPKPGLGQQ